MKLSEEKVVYEYSGGRFQIFLLLVFIPCGFGTLWASLMIIAGMKANASVGSWLVTIVLAAIAFVSSVWCLNWSINGPIVRRIAVMNDGLTSITYTYLWGRLRWQGKSDLIKRAVIRSYDGGEGADMDYLHVEMHNGTWFCLGQCKGNLDEALKMHNAMGIESEPAMERGNPHDKLASYFKARKVMQ